MPPKVRDLERDLIHAGFSLKKGGKGSHRKYTHPAVRGVILISGNGGGDAKRYQEDTVAEAIEESKGVRK